MNNEKLRKMIMSKTFASKNSDEKALILDTYVENCVKARENENQENERKYKKSIINAGIISITIFAAMGVLILFYFNPSESGVKAFDICFAAILKLISFLLKQK